ncbi:hypothetical protein U1E44_08400 [Arenibacter sp. GZD96]|uniref:hypothetical protein n=1 Tax=Aurantibrevibacter litoralis TaxID=3106030 RepID=UPI002AFFABE7|nr:hypothetical protein [Arenibacter sp. GZD-96]MEA1786107.1 hypothetical protein [Arenibacter sp. GZD-96]
MKKNRLIRSAFIMGTLGLCSCEDLLEVPDISNATIELLAPKDSTVVNTATVNFHWNGISDADGYLVQVAAPNFENASQILLDSIIVLDSAFVGTRASLPLPNGSFQWRVKGINSGFETGFSTAAFEVNITP